MKWKNVHKSYMKWKIRTQILNNGRKKYGIPLTKWKKTDTGPKRIKKYTSYEVEKSYASLKWRRKLTLKSQYKRYVTRQTNKDADTHNNNNSFIKRVI